MEITIRPAGEADVEGILAIVNAYAAQNLMLPRTAEQIRAALKDFLVAEHEGRVVGCGSNVPLNAELTELRSLAVLPEYRSTGLGRRLVEMLVAKARADRFEQICALTLVESFFTRMGFVTVDRWAIPPKIWHECIYCPKFDACDEIAMLMNLTEPQLVPRPIAPEVSLELWQGLYPLSNPGKRRSQTAYEPAFRGSATPVGPHLLKRYQGLRLALVAG